MFFIDNPEVIQDDGLSLTELVVKSVCRALNISQEETCALIH